MKTGWWLAFAAAALFSSGCSLIVVGKPGSGNVQSETRSTEPFTAVQVDGAATLTVHWGPQSQVQITTDDNLLPLIESTVRDGKLVIRPSESLRPSTGVIIDVTTSDLRELEANGSMNVQADRHDYDRLRVELNGASDFKATGTANELEIEVHGASDVDTQELQARSVKFMLSGAGGAEVFASQSLDANISGAGSLVYHGNPAQVKDQLSGVGTIHAADAAEEKSEQAKAEADEKLLEKLD